MIGPIYTIGHSTHSIEDFVKMLQGFEIGLVADVRTIPRSRHNPQFNQDALQQELLRRGIGYVHLARLGGLRRPAKDSVNTAWKNSSFRGFADYMQTSEFKAGLEQLIQLASEQRTAILCAEAVPWRCHRSLIADSLLVRNIPVEDIISGKVSRPHKLTPWARVDGEIITYPGQAQGGHSRQA